jgi:hypothetical protein
LSLRDARDGDWRRFVQRRCDGVATEAEFRLADGCLLGQLKKSRKKARDAERHAVWMFMVLLEIEAQRRAGRLQQGVQDEAINRVCDRFHVGRTAVLRELAKPKKDTLAWFSRGNKGNMSGHVSPCFSMFCINSSARKRDLNGTPALA